MRAVPDQIARCGPGDWTSMGTDRFGRSDTRTVPRCRFGIDAASISLRVLRQLVIQGGLDRRHDVWTVVCDEEPAA